VIPNFSCDIDKICFSVKLYVYQKICNLPPKTTSPVKPIHTVGAGDSFDAGFIAAQSEGQGTLGSIRFACATAALKISQDTLPTRQAIEAYLAIT
jgi:sugar/nucleoside kinase (ribokinase family)